MHNNIYDIIYYVIFFYTINILNKIKSVSLNVNVINNFKKTIICLSMITKKMPKNIDKVLNLTINR